MARPKKPLTQADFDKFMRLATSYGMSKDKINKLINEAIKYSLENISIPKIFKLEEMTLQDYFDLFTNYNAFQKIEIIEGILDAQTRKVDYAELWLGKEMNPNKPFMIKLGEDIPISFFYGKAEIKWIENRYTNWKTTHLIKDQAFIFNPKQTRSSNFELYEFPVQKNQQAPILPKTDYYLYLSDTYLEAEVEEILYNAYGVQIVKKFKTENALTLLATRIKLLDSAPTATNTLMAIQVMEAILMDKAKEGKLDSFLEGAGEKTLDRFEKLKNLALGTNQFEERKLAIARCYQSFQKLIGE